MDYKKTSFLLYSLIILEFDTVCMNIILKSQFSNCFQK